MAFRKPEKDRKPLNKPKGVRTFNAEQLRQKRRTDPDRERLAKAIERGMCE